MRLRRRPPPRQRPLLEELEPRILFSADAAAGLLAPGHWDGQAEVRLLEPAAPPPAAAASSVEATQQRRHEIVFIDRQVEGYQALVDDLVSHNDGSREVEIFLLDPNRDGIEQISQVLGQRQPIDALHLISHGADGEVALGSAILGFDTLRTQADQIKAWGNALAPDADLLIYGCDVAASAEGKALVTELAQLTGADVAASSDRTGTAVLGGDWDLEFAAGAIEADGPFATGEAPGWGGLLASVSPTTTADVLDAPDLGSIATLLSNPGADGNVSLREAVIAANNTAGADAIALPSGTYVVTRAGAGEDAAATGDLDITDTLTITGAGSASTVIDGNALDRVFHVQGGVTATLTDITIRNGAPPGDWGGGARVEAGATLNLSRAVVTANTGVSGAGLYNYGTLNAIDTTINNNATAWWGGGLYNDRGVVVLDRVTISGNSANQDGGGIYNTGAGAALSLTNVTVSGNTSAQDGGGIYTSRSITVTSSTIAFNSSPTGADGIHAQGAVSATLKNTILYNPAGVNANKAQTSAGNNLDSDGTAGLAGAGDQSGTVGAPIDPILGPLQNNGGTTSTHALLAGSPAINTGTTTGAPPTDQRGVARLGTTDIGAYEYTLIGYEPFAYPAGSFNGANGGSGWAAGWSNAGVETTVVSTGLQSPGGAMPVSGATAQLTIPSSFGYVAQTRDLATNLGAASTTTWLSFLVEPGSTTLGDYVGLRFGSPSATRAFAGIFGNQFVIEQAGGIGSVAVSGIAPQVGQTYLLTVKMEFTAGTDALTLYVNPTPGLAGPDSVFRASKNNLDLGAFTQIELAGGRGFAPNNASLDEVRIAGSYIDVAPARPRNAPVLDPARSPALTAQNEDSGAPAGAVGTLVSSLVDFPGGGGLDNVTDTDPGALLGIAITAADTTAGSWWYSTDAGSTWNAMGAVADGNARLLAADASTRICFQPDANYSGALGSAITFRAWDRVSGSNGALASTVTNGGATAFSSATDTASLTVTAVNDAPLATNLGVAESYVEDTTLNLTDIVVSDDDSTSVTATLTLSNAAAGSLNTATSGTVTSTYVVGTGVWSASGAIADVNTLLAGLTFTPSANFNGSFSIATSVDDGVAAPTIGSKAMTGTAVNDAPTATNRSRAETYTEDTALDLINIVVSDVDSVSVTATLTLSNVAAGSLNTATSGAVTSTYDPGTGVWSASGAIADVNTLLAGLTFTPSLNFNGSFSIATSVDDGVAAPITGSKAMTGTAVNDGPTATNLGVAESYTEDTALNLVDIVATDVDGADITATLTLSNAAAGTLNTATSGAVTSTYDPGTGVWSASGAIADVNTLLAGLTFTPSANFNGNFSIASSISDGIAAPITGSKAMTGTAVNDAPTAVDDTAATDPGIAVAVNVKANDSDPDNSRSSLVVTILSNSAGTTATVTTGNIIHFDPALTSGAQTVTYRLSDGLLDSNVATLTVNVAANTPPDSADVSASLNEDTDYIFSGGDFPFADVDVGQTLVGIRIDALPAAGTLRLNGVAVSALDVVAITQINANQLVYTPVANANGAPYSSFGFSVQDNFGAFDATPNNFRFDVVAVNDAPTATSLSTAETYIEDAALNLTDIVVSDVDSADVTATLTLSDIAAGSLSTATSGAVTSTFVGGVWTATGAINDVNVLLAGLTFTPALDYNGSFSIATSVDDGVAAPIIGSKAMTGTAVNDGPTATNLGVAESYTEDSPLNFTDIVVSDVDGTDVTATLTLSNVASGSLNTATSGAVTSTYNPGTGVWSASGAIADVNTLLAGLTFTPSLNFNSSFSIATSLDDGVAAPITGSKAMTGTAVNDAPVATNLGVAESYSEGTALNLTDIVVSDVDSANVTATLTLSDVAAGTLNTATSGAVTSTYNPGTGVWSASGAIADVNTLLAGLTFTPSANFNSSFSIATSVSDGVAAPVTGSKAMTGIAVDDAPTATSLSTAETYIEDAALNLTDIVVSDVDSADVTATLTLSDIAAGSLSTATSGAVTSTFVGGVWTATGAINDVNVLLAGLTFTPALDYNGSFSIATSVSDGMAAPVTATKAVTGTAVNDAPTATNLGVAETYTEDTAQNLINIVVSDVDSANVTATLTLSDVAAGTLNTATSGAVTSTYNPSTGVWSASGAIADVNTLLAGLTFTPSLNFNSSFSIATSLDDGVAAPVTGSKAVTGRAVNDAPVVSAVSLTVSEGQTVTLSGANFGCTDPDDATFTYRVSAVTGGFFQLSSAGGTPITSFTSADLAGSQVQFVHDGNEVAPAFGVTVNDGDVDSNTLAATINYTPANDAPTGAPVVAGTATEGQTLTADTSSIADADGLGAFSYQWQCGGVDVGGATASTYTLRDADVGASVRVVVSYTDGGSTLEALASAAVGPVANVNDAAVIGGITTGTVTEDGVLTVGGTLSVSDPDAGEASFVAQSGALSATGYGSFSVTATGDWSYALDNAHAAVQGLGGGQPLADSFVVTSADGTTQVVSITITGANDAPIADDASASGLEDRTLAITLGGADLDGAIAGVRLLTLPSTGGALYLDAAASLPASAGVAYAATDNALTLYFRPSPDWNGTAAFQYETTDGEGAISAPATAGLSLAPVADAPRLQGLSGAQTYLPNTALDLADIVVADPDSTSLAVTLTLSDPAAGTLSTGVSGPVTSSYDAATGTWTASGPVTDVNSLLAAVTFVPSAGYSTDVTLIARVDDGESVPSMGTAVIGAARPAVDARTGGILPAVSDTSDPGDLALAPTGGTVTASTAPPVSDPSDSDAAGSAGDETEAAIEGGLTAEAPRMDPLPVARAPDTRLGYSAPDDVVRSARQPADSGASRMVLVPAWMAEELPQFATFPANPGGDHHNLSSFAKAGPNADARAATLARDLDELRENVTQGTSVEEYALSSAVAVSSGLSVGYVAWLVRGGVLLSTLLSSMPAWRVLDPFPVLAKQRESDEDDDDDSLESMISDDGTADEPPEPDEPDDRDGAGNAAPGR